MRYQCSLPFALRGDFLWGYLPLYPGRFAIAIFFIDMGCTPSLFLFPQWFLAEHKKKGRGWRLTPLLIVIMGSYPCRLHVFID